MLLSQAQVSVVLSSGIIAIFTILLFLSGYAYQQQTVKGLQEAIKPRVPQAPPVIRSQDGENAPQPELPPSRFFSREGARIAYTDIDIDIQSAGSNVNWDRLAHLQVVRNHHDLCSAIMVLADFHRMRSPAKRVLAFPKEWAEEKEASKGAVSDPYLATTRRLMRIAARRFHVELRPVSAIVEDSKTYSLASAFDLSDFDRVLTLETPGLLMDAEPLDAILAFTEATPLAMLHDTFANDGVHSEDLLLLQPSHDTYQDLTKRIPTSGFNDTWLPSLFPDPLLLASSSEDSALVRSVGTLHDAQPGFNQTAYTSNVAYIRFSDPKLPGPEYDVPWSAKVAARPRNKDADWTWTKLYTEFAQKRVDICGLDLESWRP